MRDTASMQRNAELRSILDRFAGARIAVVGDLVADEYLYGETERVSREAPVLIVRYESSDLKPGCGANAVANLCALGARVLPVGLVGDDATGARLRQLLEEAGADISGVLSMPGVSTATKTRVLAGGKNTRRQQMLRIDRDGPGAPPAALLARLLRAVKEAARNADAVMVSDYGAGLFSPPVVEAVLGLARQGHVVCADSRYGLSQYRGVTQAKPNEVELEQLAGRPLGGDLGAIEEAGRELLRSLSASSLLITRGRAGMLLLRPGAPAAALPVHGSATAVDVTGAGDTVMAANTLGIACGADPVQAARLANVAGSLVVQKPGTATVSAGELRKELLRAAIAGPELLERSPAFRAGAQEPARRRRARR
ncbi:MAG TPA: PfkB family carbohydrate kinase [Myxococcales bacterium]|nr:PfkB family carbohydrate kinase [Myxococcales bacterium]